MPLGLIALFTSLLFFPMPGVGIVGLCSVYSLRGEFDSGNRKLEKTPVISTWPAPGNSELTLLWGCWGRGEGLCPARKRHQVDFGAKQHPLGSDNAKAIIHGRLRRRVGVT